MLKKCGQSTYFHIYLILNKKLKDYNIIDSHKIPFSEFKENVDDLKRPHVLKRHGAPWSLVNYLAFSAEVL